MSNVDAIFKSANKILVLKSVAFLSSNKSSGEGSAAKFGCTCADAESFGRGGPTWTFFVVVVVFIIS